VNNFKNTDQDTDLINSIVKKRGKEFVKSIIEDKNSNDSFVLTIITNFGTHPPPSEHLHGEIFSASEGILDFSSIDSVNLILDEINRKLLKKLKEKRWEKIYLIPFGHTVVNMSIKLTVFRVLWMDTIDVFYFGNNKYGEVMRDSRVSATNTLEALPSDPENV
jgi:hypothetical protein